MLTTPPKPNNDTPKKGRDTGQHPSAAGQPINNKIKININTTKKLYEKVLYCNRQQYQKKFFDFFKSGVEQKQNAM